MLQFTLAQNLRQKSLFNLHAMFRAESLNQWWKAVIKLTLRSRSPPQGFILMSANLARHWFQVPLSQLQAQGRLSFLNGLIQTELHTHLKVSLLHPFAIILRCSRAVSLHFIALLRN